MSAAFNLPLQGSQYIVLNENQTHSTLPPFPCLPIGHDLNTGIQKINHLGKPAGDIITPNEYTLDMIPSPLFYVDILDSQISDNNVSAVRSWHENSHIIQITSLCESICQVEVW